MKISGDFSLVPSRGPATNPRSLALDKQAACCNSNSSHNWRETEAEKGKQYPHASQLPTNHTL